MLIIILLLNLYCVCVLTQTSKVAPQSTATIDDGTYCLLFQRVARDPAVYHNTYKDKRSQKCKLNVLGGQQQAIFNYRLNNPSVPKNMPALPVLDSANTIITRDNLDRGNLPPISALIYAKKLGGGEYSNTIAGQVLGASLGGTGIEITNIIPMAKETQIEYLLFEKTIHDCLANYKADKASLSWVLLYRQTSDSRPFKITYRVEYKNGIDECKNGVSKIFLN